MGISVSKFAQVVSEPSSLVEVKECVLAAAEGAAPDNVVDIEVLLDDACYMVEEPLVFSAEEHPCLASVRLTVKAGEGARPVFSGLKTVMGSAFTPVEGTPYYKYQFEKDEKGEYPKFYDFFRREKRLQMAHSPIWENPLNLLPEQRRGEVPTEGLYVPIEEVRRLAESGVGSTQLRMRVQWQQYILRVKGVDLSATMDMNGKTYALVKLHEEFEKQFVSLVHEQLTIKNSRTYFENCAAYLSEPDTFAYDWKTGTVYVVPENPERMAEERYDYTTVAECFSFKGMNGLCLAGLTFLGFTSPFICKEGYFGTLANRELRVGKLRHAPVVTSNVRDLAVRDCSFEQLGTNGIMLCDRTVKAEITACRFVNVGMCAISIGNYRVGRGWWDEENRTYGVKLQDNYFERIAYEYPNAPAIFLGFCDGAVISHNTLDGCGYSAIAAGDGYDYHSVTYELGESVNLRNVEIAYNRFLNFMGACRDGGAIYVTGANCTVTHEKRFNFIHHNFVALEDIAFYDQIGYYLDGAASNWDVYDNVADNCGTALYIQHNVNLGPQHTHHNHVTRFYSTTPVAETNHTPARDVYLKECYVENEGLDTLFERYPAAREIYENSGRRH